MNCLRISIVLVIVVCAGCQAKSQTSRNNLAGDRAAHTMQLRLSGPAPQPFENRVPPPGVKEVVFASGDLKLKGWMSDNVPAGAKQPAVVFLHGGFAFGDGDWEDAAPFAKAGFVLFMPMLRGENGNPGSFESFYGEVDDAIAAGKYVASLPEVDADNVFVTGHSVGGVLTCLVSMMPSPYKAGAPLDGYVDMPAWAKGSPDEFVPYDRSNRQELQLRNPLDYAASIQIPLRIYVGDDGREVNARLAAKAKQAGKDCQVVMVGGDHHAMVAPAVEQASAWFKELMTR